MLEEYLVQSCQIITPTINEFGGYDTNSSVTESCRFREIPTVRTGSYAQISDADSMLWLGASSSVTEDKLILFDSKYYRIEKLTKARRLGETSIQFIKCELTRLNLDFS